MKPFEQVFVTSTDGARSALRFRRAQAQSAPVVLCIPAMGIPAAYYDLFSEELAALGVHVGVVELRGIGSSTLRASRGVDFGYATIVERDLLPAIECTRTILPDSPIWLLGHSLGGHLASALVAVHPDIGVQGPILVASGLGWYRYFGRSRGLVVLTYMQTAAALAQVVGHFPGAGLGFGGREARTLIGDLARIVRTGRFEPKGLPRIETAMASLRRRVWAISLAGDALAPERAVTALLGRFRACEVEHWRYVAEAHGAPPVDHNRWPRRSGPIARRIAEWVTQGTETMQNVAELPRLRANGLGSTRSMTTEVP